MKKIDTEDGAQLENCISCFPSSNAKWNTSLWEQNGNVRKRRRNAVILKFTVFILLRWLQISNQNARTLTQAPLPLLRWLLGSSLLPLRPSKCLSPSFLSPTSPRYSFQLYSLILAFNICWLLFLGRGENGTSSLEIATVSFQTQILKFSECQSSL